LSSFYRIFTHAPSRGKSSLGHFHWVYVFRCLKANLFAQSGAAANPSALNNLQALRELATQRRDNSIVLLSLMYECLAHAKSARTGRAESFQTCLAQAATYQLANDLQNSSILLMLRLIDLVLTMQDKVPSTTAQKLRDLRMLLDHTDESYLSGKLNIPVRKHISASSTMSDDTLAVVVLGANSDEFDSIIVSLPDRLQLYGMVYVFRVTYLKRAKC